MKVSSALKQATIQIKTPTTPTPKEPNAIVTDQPAHNSLMATFFNLNPTDINKETSKKMDFIYNWASKRTTDDMGIAMILKDLKYRLGSSGGLVTPVERMYNYVKLRSIAQDSEIKAKAMEA